MKLTRSNMSPLLKGMIDRVISHKQLHVDAVNGSDSNDGLTKEKAFKTLERLSSELINKIHTYVYVSIHPGNYDEGISIFDASGNIYISGIGQGVAIRGFAKRGIAQDVYSNVFLSNNVATVSFTNINFNHDSIVLEEDKKKAQFITYANRTTSVQFTNCTFDGLATLGKHAKYPRQSPTGVFVTGGNNVVSINNKFSNCGIVLYAENGSNISSAHDTFENIVDGYAITNGSTINIVESATGAVLPQAKAAQRHYPISTIEEGSIIETGTNENGTYYKYANGLLVCTRSFPSYAIGEVINGQKFNSGIFTFPITPISNTGYCSIEGYVTNSNGTVEVNTPIKMAHTGNTAWQFYFTNDAGANVSRILNLSFVYIGRWK